MSVFNNKNSYYERGLQNTKVKSIMYKNTTKAIINITYLNTVYNKQWNNENQNFLVGIYISTNNDNEKILKNKEYKITLDGKIYTQSKLITKDDTLYKNIPLKNPWATYYVLSFDTNKTKTINFEYTHSKFGKVILPFAKE